MFSSTYTQPFLAGPVQDHSSSTLHAAQTAIIDRSIPDLSAINGAVVLLGFMALIAFTYAIHEFIDSRREIQRQATENAAWHRLNRVILAAHRDFGGAR